MVTKDDEETPIAYIENLERDVAELKAENQRQYEYLSKLQIRDNQNRVYINVLREALEYQKTRCEDVIDIRLIDEALASTPAQALQAHDNEILTKEREEIIATLEYHGPMFADEVCEDYIRPRLLKGKL